MIKINIIATAMFTFFASAACGAEAPGVNEALRQRLRNLELRISSLEKKVKLLTAALAASNDSPRQEQHTTVYVTRTGKRYHRSSCSYLRSSKIPTRLKDAALRYTPCPRCRPPKPKPEVLDEKNHNHLP